MLAQLAMNVDPALSPIIAVNPAYSTPVSVAKQLTTLGTLYQRRLACNLVPGSFLRELREAGDALPTDDRNERLREFAGALATLTGGSGPADFAGKHYRYSAIDLHPRLAPADWELFVSGAFSSEPFPGAQRINYVRNMPPLGGAERAHGNGVQGLACGICARETQAEALQAAEQLYPEDPEGAFLFEMGLANSETPWNRWLRKNLAQLEDRDSAYYLAPLKNSWSPAPFLVGSYEFVADRIRQFKALGYEFFLLDFADGEQPHVARCLKLATRT